MEKMRKGGRETVLFDKVLPKKKNQVKAVKL